MGRQESFWGTSAKRRKPDENLKKEAAEHPLGWTPSTSSTLRWGARADSRDPEDHSEGRQRWKQASEHPQGDLHAFLGAASRIPGCSWEPHPLGEGVKVVVKVPHLASDQIEVVCLITPSPGNKYLRHLPSPADFDGAPAVTVSCGADASGKWTLEATSLGDIFRLKAPAWCLLWHGAQIRVVRSAGDVVGSDGGEEDLDGYDALVDSDRADRLTKSWRIALRKRLSLLPANLQQIEARGGLHRGAAVQTVGLQVGAAYNGLVGTVVSACPNEKGRWDVEVYRKVFVPVSRIEHPSTPISSRSRVVTPAAHPSGKAIVGETLAGPQAAELPGRTPSWLRLGAEVSLCGLSRARQHNGRIGVVLGRAASQEARWRVQVLDDAGKPLLLDLLLDNLVPTHSGEVIPNAAPLPACKKLPESSNLVGSLDVDPDSNSGSKAASKRVNVDPMEALEMLATGV